MTTRKRNAPYPLVRSKPALARSSTVPGDKGAFAKRTSNRTELKRAYTYYHTTMSNTWALDKLPAPSEGDGPGDRNGRAIKTKYFQFQARMSRLDSFVGGVDMRIIFFSYRNPRDTPVPADILSGTGATHPILATYGISEAGNYRVLYDKIHRMECPNHEADLNERIIQGVVKNEATQTFYSGSNDTIQDVGYYFLVCYSNGTISPFTMALAQTFIDM